MISLPILPRKEHSPTSLGTMMDCPQKYAFEYYYRLRLRSEKLHFKIGDAVHEGIRTIISPTSGGRQTPAVLMKRVSQALKNVQETFELDGDSHKDLSFFSPDELQHAQATASAMLRAWSTNFLDTITKFKVKPKDFEIEVYKDSLRTSADPVLSRMTGFIDGIVTWEGEQWILEHKTAKTLEHVNAALLAINLQAVWYTVAARRILNRPVAGFIYNVIAKPQHRLKEGAQELETRMHQAMMDRPDSYFAFEPIRIEEHQEECAYNNIAAAMRLADRTLPPDIVKNTRRCGDYGGCPFQTLCINGADANKPNTVYECEGIDSYERKTDRA